MGRPKKLSTDQEDEIRRLRVEEGLSVTQIAKRMGLEGAIRQIAAVVGKEKTPPNVTLGQDGKLHFEGVYLPQDEETLNRELDALRRWQEIAGEDKAAGQIAAPDPGANYDPATYVRRLVVSVHKPDDLRLKAAELLLREQRQRRKDQAEMRGQGQVDWQAITASDIPSEVMGRVAGIGAQALLLDKAPFLASAATPAEVTEVWYLTGEHVDPDVARAILSELRPALDRATAVAKASRAKPIVADTAPVWAGAPDVPVG